MTLIFPQIVPKVTRLRPKGESPRHYKTWTVDYGLDCGLDYEMSSLAYIQTGGTNASTREEYLRNEREPAAILDCAICERHETCR